MARKQAKKKTRIKVDRGVPPPQQTPRYREALSKLEVHRDESSRSSFAEFDPDNFPVLRNAVSNIHRDTDMRFRTKKRKERHPKTRLLVDAIRVWRIK